MTPDTVTTQPSPSATVVQEAIAWPGREDGLLGRHPFTTQSLDGYLSAGGYTTPCAAGVLATAAGIDRLLGHGGAAFPTSVKIEAVRRAAASAGLAPIVVANGAEGEPLSIKDRYLLRFRPHLVLEGLVVVAEALGASGAHLYVADPLARAAVETAVAELAVARPTVGVHVFQAQETYVSGEETAVVRALTRGIARPTDKPPRPFQVGVGGAPTLVLNVETLACIARSLQPPHSDAGATFLATVSGGGRPAVLYELPDGTPLHEVTRAHFGDDDTGRNLLIGGFFGAYFPPGQTSRSATPVYGCAGAASVAPPCISSSETPARSGSRAMSSAISPSTTRANAACASPRRAVLRPPWPRWAIPSPA